MSKDFSVTVTVRNARLQAAMRENGFSTAGALAKAAKISGTMVGRYLALKLSPYNSAGELRLSVLRLSGVLRRLPDDLFPPSFLRRCLEINSVTVEMDERDVAAIMAPARSRTPEGALLLSSALGSIDAALATLRPRERRVLELRFGLDGGGERTLDDVAEGMGVTRARIRQIEAKAVRKLRHPSRAPALSSALEDIEADE